jgi:hypothetical protein
VAADFDALEAQGHAPVTAIEIMRSKTGRYDVPTLDVLELVCGVRSRRDLVREVALSALEEGMVLAEDLKLTTGAMLAARGYEVTRGFVERARNFSHSVVNTKIRVVMRSDVHQPVAP